MGLTVALDEALFAEGHLYWDDGVRIGTSGVSYLPKTLYFAVGMAGSCQERLHPWRYSKPKFQQTKPNLRM